jgi:hypothetical protein
VSNSKNASATAILTIGRTMVLLELEHTQRNKHPSDP